MSILVEDTVHTEVILSNHMKGAGRSRFEMSILHPENSKLRLFSLDAPAQGSLQTESEHVTGL
jgi:hypothetical protein